jgi:hypothetical protein
MHGPSLVSFTAVAIVLDPHLPLRARRELLRDKLGEESAASVRSRSMGTP